MPAYCFNCVLRASAAALSLLPKPGMVYLRHGDDSANEHDLGDDELGDDQAPADIYTPYGELLFQRGNWCVAGKYKGGVATC